MAPWIVHRFPRPRKRTTICAVAADRDISPQIGLIEQVNEYTHSILRSSAA